jgi:hypothetical protein
MKHHHEEEVKSYDYLYYLVGLLSGLFIGVTLESSFIWVPILGLFGLCFAGFFVTVFVKGRGEKA